MTLCRSCEAISCLGNPLLTAYNTNKRDDDPILESMGVRDSTLLKKPKKYLSFPFYQANLQDLLAISFDKMEAVAARKNKTNATPLYVVPIDPYRLMWLKSKKQYANIIKSAFINLPVGSGLLWMSKILANPIPELTTVVSYVMSLLRLAEAKNYSIFLVGGTSRSSEKLFFNLKHAFPNLLIVGRHHCRTPKKKSEQIRQAIEKMNPQIVLMDLGHKGGLEWMKNYKHEFGNSLVIDMPNEFDILTGFKKSPPNFFKQSHLVWLWDICKNPLRIFRLIHWFFLVLFKRVFI